MSKCWYPSHDPSCSGEEDMEGDVTVLTTARDEFMYVILLFKVFAVPLKYIIVKGLFGQGLEYDIFIWNCSSLDRPYPAELIIKDAIKIKVDYICI